MQMVHLSLYSDFFLWTNKWMDLVGIKNFLWTEGRSLYWACDLIDPGRFMINMGSLQKYFALIVICIIVVFSITIYSMFKEFLHYNSLQTLIDSKFSNVKSALFCSFKHKWRNVFHWHFLDFAFPSFILAKTFSLFSEHATKEK